MNTNAYLKFGGLAFSAALTMSLFARLFGTEAYGITLAIAALVLFEGGAIAWERTLDHAEGAQRGIAYGALWFCAIASVVSSCTEIILATDLWTPAFDIEFVTLIIISIALGVNILGALAFNQLDPDVAEKHKELDRMAKELAAQNSIMDMYTAHTLLETKKRAKENSQYIADSVGADLSDTVARKFTQRPRNTSPRTAPAQAFARDAAPMPAAGGGARQYTDEELQAMIDEAVARALAVKNPKAKPPTQAGG